MRVPPELVAHIVKYLDSSELCLVCLTCKQLNAIAGSILWHALRVPEDDAAALFKALESSDARARSVRELTISSEFVVEPQHPPRKSSPELCALFAKVLRKMDRLRVLRLHCAALAGPAVIAELCAQQHSKLNDLILTIGELDDAEDLSVLQELKLETGELDTLTVYGCVQTEYPRPYADAIARIVRASAGRMHSLTIDDTAHVRQFFQSADRFPLLQVLDIRDHDILALPSVFPKRMTELSVYCEGDALGFDVASCVVERFRWIETLRVRLETAPADVERLMDLGEWLIEPIGEVYTIVVVVGDNIEDGSVDGGGNVGINNGEEDGDVVMHEADGNGAAINQGGGAGGLRLQNEEHSVIGEWEQYSLVLNCVEFFYHNAVRTWRLDLEADGFGGWNRT